MSTGEQMFYMDRSGVPTSSMVIYLLKLQHKNNTVLAKKHSH